MDSPFKVIKHEVPSDVRKFLQNLKCETVDDRVFTYIVASEDLKFRRAVADGSVWNLVNSLGGVLLVVNRVSGNQAESPEAFTTFAIKSRFISELAKRNANGVWVVAYKIVDNMARRTATLHQGTVEAHDQLHYLSDSERADAGKLVAKIANSQRIQLSSRNGHDWLQ